MVFINNMAHMFKGVLSDDIEDNGYPKKLPSEGLTKHAEDLLMCVHVT